MSLETSWGKEIEPRPVELLVKDWLDRLDKAVERSNPVVWDLSSGRAVRGAVESRQPSSLSRIENRMINAQLAVVFMQVLRAQASKVKGGIVDESGLGWFFQELECGTREGRSQAYLEGMSPAGVMQELEEKQKDLAENEGASFQFWTIGVEVEGQAKNVAFKLHALQELGLFCNGMTSVLRRVRGEEQVRMPGDMVIDEMVKVIWENRSRYRVLARLLGPSRGSVRAVDYLPVGEEGVKARDCMVKMPEKHEYLKELLTIGYRESPATPGVMIQVLKKGSVKSRRPMPPLSRVEDKHTHSKKIELYALLSGPGLLRVRRGDTVHTYTPDPNLRWDMDIDQLGARVGEDGEVRVVYREEEYEAEEGAGCIWVRMDTGRFVRFVVVGPGEVHDFQNQNITPGEGADAYALSLGLPKKEGASIEGDFVAVPNW